MSFARRSDAILIAMLVSLRLFASYEKVYAMRAFNADIRIVAIGPDDCANSVNGSVVFRFPAIEWLPLPIGNSDNKSKFSATLTAN